jgi:hypothetical protein
MKIMERFGRFLERHQTALLVILAFESLALVIILHLVHHYQHLHHP